MDEPETHFLQGDALARLGRHEAALAAFARATGLDSTWNLPFLARGIIFCMRREEAQALEAINRAIEADGDFADSYTSLCIFTVLTGRDMLFGNLFEEVFRRNPDDAVARNAYGVYEGFRDNSEKVKEAILLAFERLPEYPFIARNALSVTTGADSLQMARRLDSLGYQSDPRGSLSFILFLPDLFWLRP